MGARGNALFVVGVVAVLALVGLGYVYILGVEESAPVAPLPPPDAEAEPVKVAGALVERADGSVEIKVGDAWERATPGMTLEVGADLRTGRDASAAVRYGDGVAAEVSSDSALKVDRLDSEVTRFVVGKGTVVLDVKPDGSGRVVQLTADGSDAVLETRDGRVSMLNDGQGNIQAAVTRGEALFGANGAQVKLNEGQQSTALEGAKPTKPTPIPKSLLLKVDWPAKTTAKRRHRVQGSATPGTLVRVGETVVRANAKGRFSAVVELTEGRNRISVRAVDVVGRSRAAESPEIKVDTTAPEHQVETSPNMWRKRK